MTIGGLLLIFLIVFLVIKAMDKRKVKKQPELIPELPVKETVTEAPVDTESLRKQLVFMAFIEGTKQRIEEKGSIDESDFEKIWNQANGEGL